MQGYKLCKRIEDKEVSLSEIKTIKDNEVRINNKG
jgi:hypothetical protein